MGKNSKIIPDINLGIFPYDPQKLYPFVVIFSRTENLTDGITKTVSTMIYIIDIDLYQTIISRIIMLKVAFQWISFIFHLLKNVLLLLAIVLHMTMY